MARAARTLMLGMTLSRRQPTLRAEQVDQAALYGAIHRLSALRLGLLERRTVQTARSKAQAAHSDHRPMTLGQ